MSVAKVVISTALMRWDGGLLRCSHRSKNPGSRPAAYSFAAGILDDGRRGRHDDAVGGLQQARSRRPLPSRRKRPNLPTRPSRPKPRSRPTQPSPANAGTGGFTGGGTLNILVNAHFVPAYDKWLDEWAAAWGKKNNVQVSIDRLQTARVPGQDRGGESPRAQAMT